MIPSNSPDIIYLVCKIPEQGQPYPVNASGYDVRKDFFLERSLADATCSILNAQQPKPVWAVYQFLITFVL